MSDPCHTIRPHGVQVFGLPVVTVASHEMLKALSVPLDGHQVLLRMTTGKIDGMPSRATTHLHVECAVFRRKSPLGSPWSRNSLWFERSDFHVSLS